MICSVALFAALPFYIIVCTLTTFNFFLMDILHSIKTTANKQQLKYFSSLPLVNNLKPFESHEKPRQNFSLEHQYKIKTTSDEKRDIYQLGDYYLIQYQFLRTNIIRIVWLTVRRITNEICCLYLSSSTKFRVSGVSTLLS